MFLKAFRRNAASEAFLLCLLNIKIWFVIYSEEKLNFQQLSMAKIDMGLGLHLKTVIKPSSSLLAFLVCL